MEMRILPVAGGTENMSQSAYVVPSARWGQRMGNASLYRYNGYDGLTDVFNNYHMGITAENIVEKYGFTREQLDQFGVTSQQRCFYNCGRVNLKDEIVPIVILRKRAM